MQNSETISIPPTRPFTTQQLVCTLALLALLAQQALAQTTGTGTAANTQVTTQLDQKAGVFCGIVKALPQSKWVGAGALVLAIIGVVMMVFGGRGGGSFLFKAIGAVIFIPGIVTLAGAFGIGC